MNVSVDDDRTFEDSLSALALVAMQDAGADGFACFRYAEAGRPMRFFEFGKSIDEHSFSQMGSPITVRFPLRHDGVPDGILAFRFPAEEGANAAKDRLIRFAATIQRVWEAQSMSRACREMIEGIIDLEMKLSDSKIASHVRGVLNESTGRTSVDAILRHVETVLRPSPTMRALHQIHRELQEKVEERNWTVQAKAILQDSRGLTEEEAYSHLRRFSRQSRKRFVDVAREVVEGKL